MRSMLENPTEPCSDASFFECLDSVMDRSKKLGDSMTGIANHAKKREPQQFGRSVKGVSESVCGLIEAATQVTRSFLFSFFFFCGPIPSSSSICFYFRLRR